eukprot:scaffold2954_cov47-Phaeocystis_antarctica.AAC.2
MNWEASTLLRGAVPAATARSSSSTVGAAPGRCSPGRCSCPKQQSTRACGSALSTYRAAALSASNAVAAPL